MYCVIHVYYTTVFDIVIIPKFRSEHRAQTLFVRYAYLTVMISLSRERGFLWLRHEPLQSLALRFGTNSFLLRDPLYFSRFQLLSSL